MRSIHPQGRRAATPSRPARWLATLLICASVAGTTGCSWFETRLERVKSAGELVVVTLPGQTTYYESPEGPAGFEHDLAKAFAEHLGVRLKLVTVNRHDEALSRLTEGKADLVAGLTTHDGAGLPVRFAPSYQSIYQQVVYRLGNQWPDNAQKLVGREIEVPIGSRQVTHLAALRASLPELKWKETDSQTSEQLLQLVWEGLLDITVADSHLISINRHYFPEMLLGFNLSEKEELAWAFPEGRDDSLYLEATRFFEQQKKSGELAQLIDRYYGPAGHVNFINMTVFHLRIQNLLPRYQRMFQKIAKKHRLDWRLLAAISYQESYWNPNAVSHTGVRGMMMLTGDTAKHLGIKNRNDPAQSIEGGARYFRQMLRKLPSTVRGTDRTWMALAAYNVGYYHLEDARLITKSQGGDPNRWSDVKERLPLLESSKWAKSAKYGFARGREPVMFVNRVRAYYDVLVRQDETQREQRGTGAMKLKAPAI